MGLARAGYTKRVEEVPTSNWKYAHILSHTKKFWDSPRKANHSTWWFPASVISDIQNDEFLKSRKGLSYGDIYILGTKLDTDEASKITQD